MNAKRDKDKESKLKTVSLEEAIEKDSEITLCPALNYEDMIISDARIEELKVALKSWGLGQWIFLKSMLPVTLKSVHP